MSQEKTKTVRVVMEMNDERKRGRKRPKTRWLGTIELGTMRAAGLCVWDVENQDEWKFRTRMADLKYLGKRRRRRRKIFISH
jgi:hypothetical protein